MKRLKYILTTGLLIATLFNGLAQVPDSAGISRMTREEILNLSLDELLEMSMEQLVFLAQKMGISIDDLLNMKTSVASKTTLTPRETPGIVSFISEDEIKLSGARDMMDILKMVPGFDFGYDVSGVTGVGLRGNWVHEGKILIMIDGQPMNEMSYFNTPFGNHFPVDQIKRVEIIRGPGSAIYGGNAELGVINIITKSGKDIQGADFSYTYGHMREARGRTNFNLNTGFKIKKWDFSAKGFLGDANRSDQVFTEYIDAPDNTIDFSDGGTDIKTTQINLGATNDKLSIRLIYDDYKTAYWYYDFEYEDNYKALDEFRTLLGEIKYDAKINNKLTLTPEFNYRYNRPFYEEGYYRNYRVDEYASALTANYVMSKKFNLVSGLEYKNNNARCFNDSAVFYSTNDNTINLNNVAFYAEGTWKLNKMNIIAGYRAEHNSTYGWASAPRIGLTGIFNKFHFKALFSGAFRSPAIGNIDASYDLEAEKSFVSELEMGYRLNDNMFMTANFYDISIKNSIVYFDTGSNWVPMVDWGYLNADKGGSDGLELEFKAKYAKAFFTVNYAFYTQALRSPDASYEVPGHANASLGMSQHKIAVLGSYKFFNKLAVSPSFNLMGNKYGYDTVDDEGNPMIGDFGPYYMVNLSVNYEVIKGLNISLSGFDLFNQKSPLMHPYYGWYKAYPGMSTEFLFKIVLSSKMFQ